MLRIIQLIKTRVDVVKKDPALRYLLRPVRYEAIDGAREIGNGVMMLSEMRQHGAIDHGTISLAQKVLLAGFGVLNVPKYVMCAVGSFRKRPWKWLLLVLMVLGPLGITLTVPGNFLERLRPVSLFVGLVWLISGGATLYSYLRHTKPPAPEAE